MNHEKAMMMCLRLEQGAPGWKMDTNSLSYNSPLLNCFTYFAENGSSLGPSRKARS